jgi:hypothetical protein
MKISVISIICISLVFNFVVSPAQAQMDSLLRRFDHYRKNSLQEKIYLHSDRSFYLTGETMWFKVYVVDGSLHRPINLSKVAYVEIVSKENTRVLQAKIELANGKGSGSLFIPASVQSSNYTIRCYTKWMDNFDSDFFFQKQVTIVNPFVKPEIPRPVADQNFSANFFPEGGDLVAGLTSRVAFMVKDQSGKGIPARGAIVGAAGDTIVRFETEKFGIGSFSFTPSNSSYQAVVVSQGRTNTYKLPETKSNGYVMTVTDSADNLRVRVMTNVDNRSASHVYLFVHSRQVVTHAETKPTNPRGVEFIIDKKKLGEGVSHMTLFNQGLEPVCERLFFQLPVKRLDVRVTTDQNQYGVRRRVKTDFTTSADGTGVPANLSVSVYKLDSLSSKPSVDIFSHYWMLSELKGHVENPEYYFNTDDQSAQRHADNLMLTHGWRRFKWDDVLNRRTKNEFVPEYRGHIISGTVRTENGSPVKGITTYLGSPDKVARVYPSISNNSGKVVYETAKFFGKRKVIAQSPSDSTIRIDIDNPFTSKQATFRLDEFKLHPSMEKLLLERSVGMQVQDVYYEGNRERFVTVNLDTTSFFGRADEIFYLDDYTRFPVMEEVMREYVPGVLVRKRRDGFHFIVLDDVNKTAMRDTPMILVDGVPIFDADKIMNFDPRKIEKLEVVRRPFYLGPTTLSGIVSYTTYTGDFSAFPLDPKQVLIDYEGLQLQREFYSPQYENEKQRSTRMPDQRNLLFWSPDINTDSTGRASLNFFSSDVEGDYLIHVEGMNSAGVSGSMLYTFSVKRFDN